MPLKSLAIPTKKRSKSKAMKIRKTYIETLGCNKNTVDSEIISTLLRKKGIEITKNPEEADYIIVNTCGFIDEAKEESINTILTLAQFKDKEILNSKKLLVTGCFSQLYYKNILKEIPEVDAVFGVGDFEPLVNAITNSFEKRFYDESFKITPYYKEYEIKGRDLSTTGFAYVKIAEGCNRKCSFCLIPKIKGSFRSRKMEYIIDEIKALQDMGIYEVILVSQDSLSYGSDIGIKNGLGKLIEEILKKTEIKWIRLLYLRPSNYILNLLALFKDSRVLPYFDIPVQHSSSRILKLMKRDGSREEYLKLVQNIRGEIPKAILRTTVIVGFPTEDERDFEDLKEFIWEAKFNHLGIFIYSPQRGTEAYSLKNRIRKSIALKRSEELYNLQSKISSELLNREVGNSYKVLIEEKIENEDIYFGRSYHFAPEIDGVFVLHSSKKMKVPALVKCIVKRTETYDLHGSLLND